MSTATRRGCVVFLVDESAAMRSVMGDVVADGKPSTKPNAERVATCINALLAQLSPGLDVDLAVVGYKTLGGQTDIGCRWGGSLAGHEFVSIGELAAAPLRTEARTRKVPTGAGTVREESVSVPIWYEPSLGEKAPQIAAYDFCRLLVSRWLANEGPQAGAPLVVHVFSSASGDGNPQMAVAKLMQLSSPDGPLVLLQAHVAPSAAFVPTLYPSSPAFLTLGPPRDLFRRASPLPSHHAAALAEQKIVVNANARGMLHNGKIADLIRLLGLVKAHTKSWTSASAQSQPAASPSSQAAPAASTAEASSGATTSASAGGEKIGLVVFVLDRGVADPFAGNLENPCARLQTQANELLKQVSKLNQGQLDVATLSYGLDGSNQCEVRTMFEGPLAGRTVVPHTELAAGAVRIDEFEEQVSNGIGGLVAVTRKNPIYYDVEPAAAAPPAPVFAAASRIVDQWRAGHPAACLPPVVLHLTRGAADGSIEQAVSQITADSTSGPTSILYHLVVTESPHKSVAYPAADDEIDEPSIKRLWSVTSPLLGRERLTAERPTIKPGARGLVINGKFDVFLEGIKDALATS